MDKVLEKLSDIEAAASRIMESANNQIQLYSTQLDEQMKEYDEKVDAENQAKLQALKASLEKDTAKKASQLETDTVAYLDYMQKAFDEKHGELVDQLFAKLISAV